MNRFPLHSLLISVLAGAAIWALSPLITGHAEPWDADGIYYGAALLLAGLGSGLMVPKPLWAIYVGSILGQVGYGLVVWSLLCWVGGYAGSRMRRAMTHYHGRPL